MGVVVGVLDGDLRGDPKSGANAVHVNECRRVAKVDDNSGASANLVSRPAFRSGQGQMECVSSISRHGRAARCQTAQTQRQRSASAKR
jgi:hypothetical protein